MYYVLYLLQRKRHEPTPRFGIDVKLGSLIQLITNKIYQMITKPELQELLQNPETYRVERTTSTNGTQDVTQGVTQGVTQNSNPK